MDDEFYEWDKYERAINKILDNSYKQNILFHEDTRWKGKKKQTPKTRSKNFKKNKQKIQIYGGL